MINGKSVLAIIPARGGSKGIPRKNIKDLAGKPLIAWTIEEAKKSRYIDRLILSSEDAEIIKVAKEFGCEVPFIRPQELAEDRIKSSDVVRHALDCLSEKYDYIILLQPTSPLRRTKHIDEALDQMITMKAESCVSVSLVKSSPYWMFYMDSEKGTLKPVLVTEKKIYQRQDLPAVYKLNGAIYISRINNYSHMFEEHLSPGVVGYIMDAVISTDIDDMLDFKTCEMILNGDLER